MPMLSLQTHKDERGAALRSSLLNFIHSTLTTSLTRSPRIENLLGFSTEILDTILSSITQTSDRNSVSKTCRTLQVLLEPVLYGTIPRNEPTG
ncbi:hypothetical protein EJ08DRAFT_648607 [Tothia fuscella]|uniref:F-box domain-containing protein n=1 Tax=Tothia fuscella TaxID=1048955 RepID=A0A9P4U0H7_9PEZI|nr:hypothetical protein EJ08DRAFT_648607 [Tothia fuscella]